MAFVVGIDRYDNLSDALQLKKAVNDATALGDATRALGYELTRAENVGRVEFLRWWNRFLSALERAARPCSSSPATGWRIGGLNYLIPRDTPRVGDAEEAVLKGRPRGPPQGPLTCVNA